ncbi:MAG: SUMF1/EgtB/PvdO family nonheme iron enzyme [Thermoguttaceae bacterium]|nr:SUMF1/EgtB/PvdO family nonheme iron enzyme [Thermoguttaceae bacterium]
MSEISRSSESGKAEELGKTGERAKRRRRAQTALLAVALGFAPFAAFAQTATSRAGTGLNGKFSVAGPVVESAPSEEKSAPIQTASRAEFKAFLVGADDYDDAPKLTCVKNDVEAFAARLVEIGFDQNNVTVLKTGGKHKDDPTKANIENRFAEFVASLKPGDFAVVFMSGHGLQNKETKEAFFAPVDLEPKKLFETAVSIDGMLARLEKSSAKCRWMIVDACRNVPASWETSEMRTRAVDGATPGLTSLIEVPESTILLQSCEPGEVSYEGGEGNEHGLFTQSLLEALDANGSKADGNSDGVLKLTELVEYVAARTNELATQNGGTQKPTWRGATTDFEILTTLIEGLPPERWRKAQALYQEARDLRREKKWRDAAAKLSEARKINAVNKDYQAAEAEIAAILDLQTQAQEAETAASEKRAEADKLAEDAWTAFDLGGEANVEKAIRLMKESLELVDLAANRRGLKTFEEELEASRNPAPSTPSTVTQPPRQVAQNAASTSGRRWNGREYVAVDGGNLSSGSALDTTHRYAQNSSSSSGRTSSGTSSTSRTSEHAADASGRRAQNAGSRIVGMGPSGASARTSSGTSSSSTASAPTHRYAQNSSSSSGQTSSGTISSSPSSAQTSSPETSSSVAWTGTPTPGTQNSLEIKGATYNFRYCPAGTFTMGSPESESGRFSWENQHEVTLTRGFWMLETEVTQALWESVTGENPMVKAWGADWKGPKKPVGRVSWEDCQEFIEKLNSLGIAPEGLKFRLPTEAEWEYACRAGTSGPYAGSSLDSMGWYKDNSDGDNHEVGKKAPNAWGLYDMHGNVREWCSDWFDSATYDAASQTDPTGPSSGSYRVLRGGCWDCGAEYCRSAGRDFSDPTYRYFIYGFRLVLGR